MNGCIIGLMIACDRAYTRMPHPQNLPGRSEEKTGLLPPLGFNTCSTTHTTHTVAARLSLPNSSTWAPARAPALRVCNACEHTAIDNRRAKCACLVGRAAARLSASYQISAASVFAVTERAGGDCFGLGIVTSGRCAEFFQRPPTSQRDLDNGDRDQSVSITVSCCPRVAGWLPATFLVKKRSVLGLLGTEAVSSNFLLLAAVGNANSVLRAPRLYFVEYRSEAGFVERQQLIGSCRESTWARAPDSCHLGPSMPDKEKARSEKRTGNNREDTSLRGANSPAHSVHFASGLDQSFLRIVSSELVLAGGPTLGKRR